MAEQAAAKTPTGRFVWRDLMTKDLEGSKKFYTEVFGWNVAVHEMGEFGKYHMLLAGEKGIGGLVSLEEGFPFPSHWVAYVTVADVDKAVEQIQSMGGSVCAPAMDIPGVGRFAVATDPQGALFQPFKDNSDHPADDKMPGAGEFCWSELTTTDPKAAQDFYAALTGWTYEAFAVPGDAMDYQLCKSNGMMVGGVMKMPTGSEARPYWLQYVAVEDTDATAARIEAAGGKLIMPPNTVPMVGRLAIAEDPHGALFGVIRGETPPA